MRTSRKNKVSGTVCEHAALPSTMYITISGTNCNLPCVLQPTFLLHEVEDEGEVIKALVSWV